MTLEVREYGEKVYYVCDRAVSVRCDACGHSHTVFHVVVKKGRVLRAIWDDRMGLRYDLGGGGEDRVNAKDVFTTKHEAVGARHEKLALAPTLAAGRAALAKLAAQMKKAKDMKAKAVSNGKAVEG